ncbi:hypothetical protein ACJJIL_16365 [Microbulbifer sp. EKSA005]|uniref:hypothetical protein n=1 Tax=Microbulbifer sp. EKSA005 TaxID=3243364 RepID=UPI0040421820
MFDGSWTWQDSITLAGFVFTVVSLTYAVYTGRKIRSIREFSRSEAWNLYARASNTNGQLQNAIKLYKKQHEDKLSPEVLENLGLANGFGQDLTRDTLRIIQLSEEGGFSLEKIKKWKAAEKIKGDHETLFKGIAMDPPRRWFNWFKNKKEQPSHLEPLTEPTS